MVQQHKALLIYHKGGRMELGLRDTPTPGAGQVLVRNIAVALNPVDAYIQSMGLGIENRLPALAGCDGAGEVYKLGADVHGWSVGDKVFYQGHTTNDTWTFQEYTIVAAARMAKIPPNVTAEQASTIPLALATAALGIYVEKKDGLRPDRSDLGGAGLTPPWKAGGRGKYEGKAALVISGSSSVGQIALQLLKASGFSPLITTASKHNEAYCKAAGATHVIDHKDVPYAELPVAITEVLCETPVSFIYDAWSRGGSQQAAYSLLAPGGSMCTVMPPEVGERAKEDAQGRRVVIPYGSVNVEYHHKFGTEMYAHLTEMLETGELKSNNVKLLDGGFEAIPAGCDELLQGVSGVKLVARVA
ncbi:GroES-like protein [Peniophora sp. CONT]|nr:GroES-like protein [Peniophora sp. CONT]